MRTRNADTPKSGPGRKAAQAKKDAAAAEKTPESSPKSAPKSTPKSSGTKVARGKKSTPKAAALATDVITPDPKQEVEAQEMDAHVEEPEKSSPEKKVEAPEESAPQTEVQEMKEDVKEDQLQSVATSVSHDEQMKPDDASAEKNEAGTTEDVGKESVFEGQDAKLDVDGKLVAESEVEIKQGSDLDEKDAPETNPRENYETETHADVQDEAEISQDVKDELDGKIEKDAFEDQQMEEVTEQDGFEEAGDEEFAAAEVGEGEGEGVGGPGDEEFAAAEVGEGEGEGVRGPGDEEEGPKLEEEEQIQISDMAKARKIKKEQEIFVGGLDRDAVEDDLKKAFENVGEVVEVRLHKDYATNKNKGFAFVKFASKEQAARALEEMKNPLIRGKRCGIAPCEDNDTLFLGNICNTWTKDAIKRKLKDYGIDTVESITLVADTQNEGLSRGFSFLEFACHPDAMAAYKRLQKPDVIFGHPERTAKVAFAEPLREPNPEVMAQVKSVFVDGLPPYWDEDHVKEHFKSFGEIERVVLARNMSTAKRKDFGFVNFTNHEAAVACVEGVNDADLSDGKSKIKVRARLANPLPKTEAVKGGMSGGFRIGHTGVGVYSRFGRGFGRGRFPFNRAGFQVGRGFYPHGRGRAGGFSYATHDMEISYPEFRGWRPYGVRGGRRGSTSGRLGAIDRGRGRGFPSRRPPFPPEGEFGGRFGARPFGEDPYFYGDGGRGFKRPFAMMEHDPSYLEPSSRLRPRYDHPDPMPGASRYRDSLERSNLYSRDYYGPDYGGSSYSSFYGGEPSGGGYYY